MAFPPNELERYRAALMRGQISPDYAAMPPYAMQNTFDKQAMQGYAGRMSPAMAPPQSVSGGSAGGMAGDMAPDSLLPPEAQAAYDAEQAMKARTQDFTDQQSAVDSQRKIAQQMRGGRSPRGRTVGPLDVYVAPNWGDVAGDVAMKLGGGYLEGRANEKGREIDEARSEQKLQQALAQEAKEQAALEVEAEERAYGRGRDTKLDERYDEQEATRMAEREADEATRIAERIEDLKNEREDAALDHERERELMELEALLEGTDLANSGLPDEVNKTIENMGSATERNAARMLYNTSADLSQLTADMKALREKNNDANWSSGAGDVGIDVAEGLPIIGGSALRNVTKGLVYDDDEQAIRAAAANSVESFRRARTGANLTGVEIKVGEDWDPTAPGIGAEESMRRTIALNNTVNQYLNTMGIPTPVFEADTSEDVPSVDTIPIPDWVPANWTEDWNYLSPDEQEGLRLKYGNQ